jgi:hypothetical protein
MKRRFLQEPHGITPQKTPFFIVTAVKTSDLTKSNHFDASILMNALNYNKYFPPILIHCPVRNMYLTAIILKQGVVLLQMQLANIRVF